TAGQDTVTAGPAQAAGAGTPARARPAGPRAAGHRGVPRSVTSRPGRGPSPATPASRWHRGDRTGTLEESGKSGGKKLDAMTLIKEDMNIFGHCPAHDEFYLVVCNHCSQVVKPQAFQKHCGEPGGGSSPGGGAGRQP
uniref:Uncharacterized protein n=1 Tax=Otus sunia TaxID=257818 RepID=A0A8C8BC24_9STRI